MMRLLVWSNGPRRTLRAAVALAAAKSGMFTVGVGLSFVGCLVVADLADTTSSEPERQVQRGVDPAVAAIARYRCSTTGFDNDETPASALVRRRGNLQHVSFATGWATYAGRAPGTLVAVCRTPVTR